MGANFCTMLLPGTLSQTQVRAKFKEAQEQDRHENGHSYSGGFGMASGLRIYDRVFSTLDEAANHLEDTCQKWEEARAVRVMTSDGQTFYYIGAWCSS
jgi:hypothetical protein